MPSITRNSHYGYDVIVALEGQSVEAFCAQYYPVLADLVGGLRWHSSEELASALHITWNEQAHVSATFVALGRFEQTNLEAYLLPGSVVFHCSPEAPDYRWPWPQQRHYIKQMQSHEFLQHQYALAVRLAELFS